MNADTLIKILSNHPDREVFLVGDDKCKTIRGVHIDDAPFRSEQLSDKRPWFIVIGAEAKPIQQNVALAKIAELSETLTEVLKKS